MNSAPDIYISLHNTILEDGEQSRMPEERRKAVNSTRANQMY